jgi:predicted RNA-binding Zn-ribbon protein involved in translation (DUF1610 family)
MSGTIAEPAPIKVIFMCDGCGQIFLAIQRRTNGTGKFDCTECGDTVYVWSGAYDYSAWKAMASTRNNPAIRH